MSQIITLCWLNYTPTWGFCIIKRWQMENVTVGTDKKQGSQGTSLGDVDFTVIEKSIF